jgi:hypothetical protein
LILNFASGYGITKLQKNRMGLKLNGTYQVLDYADDINVFGDNRDNIKTQKH